jgi:predicted tellurium resistance membrane protein TerC
MDLIALFSDPATWAALLTLIVLEVVLGIDNLVFIAILSNKLPLEQQQRARRIGLFLALGMRIGLLLLIGWLVTLQNPLFDLGLAGAPGPHGEPTFETAFSGRDLILIAGGLFLLWKATIMIPTVITTAAIITGTSSVMPTAVRIESTENTRSSAMIWAIAAPNAICATPLS